MIDTAQMLHETVSILEAHNFMELLPTEVIHWWEQRKVDDAAEQTRERIEAERFIESIEAGRKTTEVGHA